MGEVGKLTSQHHDLKSSLAELQQLVAQADGPAVQQLAEKLGDFVEALRNHFAFEEAAELFAGIAAQRPTFDREVTRLLRQHGALLDRFTEARDLAARAADVAEISAAFREASEMLLEHERAEMDLIQEAALTDLGGDD